MPWQRDNGVYYVNRQFGPLGRIAKSLRTENRNEAGAREDALLWLKKEEEWDLLRAFKEGDLSLREVKTGYDRDSLGYLRQKLVEAVTLADAIEETENTVQGRNELSDYTWSDYRAKLEMFAEFVGPEVPVKKALQGDKIAAFKRHRHKEGRARQTINNDLSAIAKLGEIAVEKGWTDEKPELSRYGYERRIEYLTSDQIQEYLDALRPEFRPLMQVLLATGIRLGQAESLRVRDLKVEDPEEGGVLMVTEKKTRGGDRPVSITSRLVQILRAHVRENSLDRGERLFSIPRRTVQKEHNRAREEIGYPEYTIHDHRHTAAVQMAKAGTPIHLIQEQLGHSDVKTTRELYANYHPDHAEVRPHLERVEEKLGLETLL